MNLQTLPSNVYLIVIPRNYTNDIHICGRCKAQYTPLNRFLEHKTSCYAKPLANADSKEGCPEALPKKMQMDNLMNDNELMSIEDSEKITRQFTIFNALLNKNQKNSQQVKLGVTDSDVMYISHGDSCVSQNNILLDQKVVLPINCKRTLHDDEEDIATLLANQLNSETSAEDINPEGISDFTLQDAFCEVDESKENGDKEEKEESKILYRGKMRKLCACRVQGCAYKTLFKKDIERHTRIHTGERPFKCFLCNKAFTRNDKLLLHQRIHAGDKRYKCTECDYASVDSGSLIKHLRVHNGERPFKCQLCSYRSRDSSQLTVHLRKHTGDSPFVCTNERCKSAFKTNSDLKRHMVVHSNEKPYSCLYCPYKCTLKRYLQVHVQSQHPNGELREYMCRLCPRFNLPTIRRLKNHMKKHHGEIEEVAGVLRKTKIRSPVNMKSSAESILKTEMKDEKRKRKIIKSNGEVPVGVMNKAFDCKLCEASFVCQDSLLTHLRYHGKLEELRKAESKEKLESTVDDQKNHKVKRFLTGNQTDYSSEHFNDSLVFNEGFIVDGPSFAQSVRNAEILATLNPVQGIKNVRQFIMTIQNEFASEDYTSVEN